MKLLKKIMYMNQSSAENEKEQKKYFFLDQVSCLNILHTSKEKFKAVVSFVKLWKNLQKISWKGFNKNGSVFYVLKSKKKFYFSKFT